MASLTWLRLGIGLVALLTLAALLFWFLTPNHPCVPVTALAAVAVLSLVCTRGQRLPPTGCPCEAKNLTVFRED